MWENLAVNELEFYKHKAINLQQIDDRLQEIEEECYIYASVGYIEEDTGLYRKSGRSVIDQVTDKVMKEEGVLKAKDKLLQRCDRIEYALSQLEDYEFHLIDKYYLQGHEDGITHRIVKETIRALRKFYRFLMIQKMDKRMAWEKERKALVKEKIKRLKR